LFLTELLSSPNAIFCQCTLATSGRCAANNFIYSSITQHSRPLAPCILKLKLQFCKQQKMIEERSQNFGIYVGGAKGVMWPHLCRKFIFQESSLVQVHQICTGWYKNWYGLYESTVITIVMYVGTHNLNASELSMQNNTYRGSHTTR